MSKGHEYPLRWVLVTFQWHPNSGCKLFVNGELVVEDADGSAHGSAGTGLTGKIVL